MKLRVTKKQMDKDKKKLSKILLDLEGYRPEEIYMRYSIPDDGSYDEPTIYPFRALYKDYFGDYNIVEGFRTNFGDIHIMSIDRGGEIYYAS